MSVTKKYKVFEYGSTWLRADFHLHTKADKEFKYSGEESDFPSLYVEGLKAADIRIGAITNHNKFNYDEFKKVRKKAQKEEIFLLPGVELSVNDGANGIHCLVIFSDEWITNGQDHINPFLTSSFTGKTPDQYERENGRSTDNLIETIKKLESYHKDFFIVFAHVEQKSGLWEEFKGGRLEELGANEFFKRRALAFQKVRSRDERTKVKGWLKESYPAEVEGSDCKNVDQIGKVGSGNEKTYLKLGHYSFEAVKYALLDFGNRLSNEAANYRHSHIKSIRFEGGVLNGKEIKFSPELNTLIGIRGSGKSSSLEAIRYVLDIPFGEKSQDKNYKDSLVAHTFGSGGKVIVNAVDHHGKNYEIKRIFNDRPEVYVDGSLQPGLSIRETILHKPIYFGQKDLSSSGEGFEKDLVEKIVGEKLRETRKQIEEQKSVVNTAVSNLLQVSDLETKKQEYEHKKSDAEYKLKIFKEHGVAAKLQAQSDFNTDERKIKGVLTDVKSFGSSLSDFLSEHEDTLKNHTLYKSKQNSKFFGQFFIKYEAVLNSFNRVNGELEQLRKEYASLQESEPEFAELKKTVAEDFAGVRRALEEELKKTGVHSLNLEEFPKLQKVVESSKSMLEALAKQSEQEGVLRDALDQSISRQDELWHEEFKLIQTELEKVNASHSSLEITIEFKEGKEEFLSFFQSVFRGSRIREATLQNLVDSYSDFSSIYKDLDKVKKEIGTSAETFEKYFQENLAALLSWQVPNKFTIKYCDKELKHHSLGQRASALILFVLSQEDNDVVIIDQPEDDLDNQTIYADVITLVRKLKPKTQFIFATHNANFPVLGDAEQIHACRYSDESMALQSGSIDCSGLQKEIVDIMEGGADAFNKRKEIYQIWKP